MLEKVSQNKKEERVFSNSGFLKSVSYRCAVSAAAIENDSLFVHRNVFGAGKINSHGFIVTAVIASPTEFGRRLKVAQSPVVT